MRVCLSCHAEYLDEPLVCRSCGADTVTPDRAALEDAVRDRLRTEPLVAVAELDGPVEQALLGRLLTAAGVPWTLHGGDPGALPGIETGAGRRAELLVPEEDVDTAREVVRRYRSSVVPEGLDDEGPVTLPEELEDDPSTAR